MRIRVVGAAILLLTSTSWAAPEGSAPSGSAPGETSGQPKAADVQAAEGTPAEQPTPDAAAQATTTAAASFCKKIIDKLAGDPGAFKSLPKDQQSTLIQAPTARDAMTCLAIATDDAHYCDMLSGVDKDGCVTQRKSVRELKGVAKDEMKRTLLYKQCLADAPEKAQCEKIRAALAEKNASKCDGLPKEMVDFCKAVATGDASKCTSLAAGEERGRCEAYATDDESKCPKDSVNCRNIARSFAALKKGGLTGLADADASMAAAVKGKAACEQYLGRLQEFCAKRL